TTLTDEKAKGEFLEQLASAAVDFVIANDTNFIGAPTLTNASSMTAVATNTAIAFKGLQQVLTTGADGAVAEKVLADAAANTMGAISDIVATDTGDTTAFSNVGNTVGGVVSQLVADVATSAAAATGGNSEKTIAVASAAISAAFDKATTNSDGTEIDLSTATDLNVDVDEAANVASKIGAEVAKLDPTKVSGNVLLVVAKGASDRAFTDSTDSTAASKGVTQMIQSMDALGQQGFDVAQLADQLIEANIDTDRLATTVDILATTFVTGNTHVSTNSAAIITATVQTAVTATDTSFINNVAQVTAALEVSLSSESVSDFETIVNKVSEINSLQLSTPPYEVTNATSSTVSIDVLVAGTGVNPDAVEDKAQQTLAKIPSLAVSAVSGYSTEAGGTASFTVFLTSEPDSQVVFDLTSSDTEEATVSPASLTFTSLDYDKPQIVEVSGLDDASDDGDTVLSIKLLVNNGFSADSPGYTSLKPEYISVIKLDNHSAAFGIDSLTGLTSDGTNFYGTDASHHVIHQIKMSTGEVTTLAGTGFAGDTDATGAAAEFNHPTGITTDGT
ncbi:MAG: hypothetical protein RPR91_13165, partial [Colwellia sp.]